MTGMIEGGWGYVWAVYLVTWGSLVAYGVSLYMRGRAS